MRQNRSIRHPDLRSGRNGKFGEPGRCRRNSDGYHEPGFARDFRFDLFVEYLGHPRGEIANVDLPAARDVEGMPIRLLYFERQPAGSSDIVNTDEIA